MDVERSSGGWWKSHPVAGDLLLAVLSFLVGAIGPPDRNVPVFATAGTGTLIVLALSCALLMLRRRIIWIVWALASLLAIASTIAIGAVSPTVLPVFVAVYTLCAETDRRRALPAAVGTTLVLTVVSSLSGTTELLNPVTYALASWAGMSAALGLATQSRRAVLAAAEERALRAELGREAEAQQRVAEERLRIARELHDVVAHHISVINVQAGVARHLIATDTSAAGVALGHVRDASRVVLEEMPVILGLLRVNDQVEDTAPTPGLAQVGDLVDTMRRAGLDVVLRYAGEPTQLAPSVDLATYRLVQEALTNALKHGTGRAEVVLEFVEETVRLTVRNPVTHTGDVNGADAGHGLIGMRERVSAAGGRLRTGRDDSGAFVVDAELGRGART